MESTTSLKHLCLSLLSVMFVQLPSVQSFHLGAEFLKKHVDFGEVFQEWKLYESARAAYNFFHKKWDLFHGPKGLVAVMGQCCDYLHPRLNRSTALQCIQHVTNAISCTLYDGVSTEDMQLLIMEATKMCVLCTKIKSNFCNDHNDP